MPPSARPARVRFSDCEFDPRSGELWRSGQRVVLPDQPFRILATLVAHAGQIVTREELQKALWPDGTFVDYEHSINAAVKRLRESIGDSAAMPTCIETVPRRGYRFIAVVEAEVEVEVEPQIAAATVTAPAPVVRPEPAAMPRRSPPLVKNVVTAVSIAVVVVACGWLVTRPSPMAGSDGLPILPHRLTTTSGVNTDPTVSWDGSLVAYASDRDSAGNLDIWVQKVGGSSALRLTTDASDESEPSFSRDGTEIVYSQRDTGLVLTGAFGGQRRVIVRSPWARTPRFSPDGQSIAYWTGFPAAVVAGGIQGALGEIFIVSVAGGEPKPLQTSLASARYPIWSDDGSQVLFLGEIDPEKKLCDWFVIGRDGGVAVRTGAIDAMKQAGLGARFPVPGAWLADGRVVFASNEIDSSTLWTMPIDPRTGRASGTPRQLTISTAIERQPAVAGNGRVVFVSAVENVDIWRLPIDPATGVASAEPERLTTNDASDRIRNVTADGTMVFISSRTGRDEVWTMDLRTREERRETFGGVDDASGSPDGRSIALATSGAPGLKIDLFNLSGGASTELCTNCSSPGDWSPDGSRVVFNRGQPSRLELMDVASKRTSELVSHPQWSAQLPRFTPDGSLISFHTANSPNVRRVYAVPASFGPAVSVDHWIPLVLDHGCHSNWSPDGTQLFYFSFRDGAFCPWVQKVDRRTNRPVGAPEVVRHFHKAGLRAASGTAAFNDVQSGYLYLTLTQSTSQIWTIDPPPQRLAAR